MPATLSTQAVHPTPVAGWPPLGLRLWLSRLGLIAIIAPTAALAALTVRSGLVAATKPLASDFGDAYVQGRTIWTYGLHAAYDTQRLDEIRSVVKPLMWFRYEFTPLQALLSAAFSWMPIAVASWLWTAFLGALIIGTWWLVRPGLGGHKSALALVLLLAPTPVMQTFHFQAAEDLIPALALVAAWRLSEEGHEGWAGVALTAALAKPQMIFLVFPALLMFRRWKIAATWAVSSVILSAVLLLILGPDAARTWLGNIADGYQHPATYLIDSGAGLVTAAPTAFRLPVAFGMVALACGAALRFRGNAREIGSAFAIGAIASPAASSFVHRPDYLIVVVGAAILYLGTTWRWRTAAAICLYASAALVPGTVTCLVVILVLGLLVILPYPERKNDGAEVAPREIGEAVPT